jgi:N-acetylmuramoyl-L-alanine amidase
MPFLSLLLLAAFLLLPLVWTAQQSASPCFQSQRFSGRTLILDAGHGGEDGGAVSITGTPESGINLAIVLKIQQLCGLFGVNVQLTRMEDRSLKDDSASTLSEMKRTDLMNRVSMINDVSRGVLISIHQNIFSDASNHGAQVFYAPTEESESWGAQCQSLLVSRLDADNRRLSKLISTDIYLMNHISCPAILVECGFLSNQQEALALENDAYQTKLAAVILTSYLTYPFDG